MGIVLTEEQSQALDRAAGTPPSVIDPRTRKTYVLLSEEVFERIKGIVLDGADSLSDTFRAQFDSAMKAGWNDPAMDDYNDYDAHRPS